MRARRLLLVVAGGLVAVAAACGGATGPQESELPAPTQESPASAQTTPTAPASSPAVSNRRCAAFPAGVRAGQTTIRALTSGGRERSYRLHIPRGVRASTPLPLVLNFHGLGSNAEQQELYSGLIPISDREGFLLVSPEGVGTPRAWASFRALSTGADDVQFVTDLLDSLQAELCVDTGAVFATGMSNGAFMSSLLGCTLEDRIAAIAPVAGLYFYPDEECEPTVPVLAFHGTADNVVPYEAGSIFGLLPYGGVRGAFLGWAGRGGCEPSFIEDVLADGVTAQSITGCETADVQLVTIDGGGHTWPGAPGVPRLGTTTKAVSAAELIWAFFEAHRR